jgi:hypothetical protein
MAAQVNVRAQVLRIAQMSYETNERVGHGRAVARTVDLQGLLDGSGPLIDDFVEMLFNQVRGFIPGLPADRAAVIALTE